MDLTPAQRELVANANTQKDFFLNKEDFQVAIEVLKDRGIYAGT